MKSTPLLLSLLILPATAPAMNLSLESSLYKVNLKGDYARETGYELWRGRKSGFLYRFLFEEESPVKRGAYFKLSITGGTTKAPYVNLLTADPDRLFASGVKSFTVRELYFHKEGFIFKNLSLTVGKQPFQIGNFLNDYLWGGKFTYRTEGGVRITWNQIAGYEGKYLLFGEEEEDDVDIFNLKVERGGISLGFYWLSDAKGKEPAETKNGLTLSLKGERGRITATTQNGELSFYGELKEGVFTLSGGYAEREFTSYGFKEGVNGIGLIYKPAFSNLMFLKSEAEFQAEGVNWRVYGLHVEKASGKLIGNELGVEGEKPLAKGFSLFGKVALGSRGSYALFGGLRWSLKKIPAGEKLPQVEVENYLAIKGEYSDFPRRDYKSQSEYEGYALAKHLGFWHTTYKAALKGEGFKVKVSTGRDTKVDYLIWGNTADNFKYQKGHGKEWHFEEAWVGREELKVGMVELSLKGFIDESLTGVRGKWREAELYCLFESDKERAKYLTLKWSKKGVGAFLLYRRGEGSNSTLGVNYTEGSIELGGLVQTEGGRESWGGFVKLKGELLKWKGKAEYRLYSKEFKTFGLKEYFWNEGFIYRPGESNLRVLKVSAGRGLRTGLKMVDRLKPQVNFFYLNLRRFSGKYVGEEGGVALSLKPGSKCSLALIGSIGNNNSYYEGVAFKVKW